MTLDSEEPNGAPPPRGRMLQIAVVGEGGLCVLAIAMGWLIGVPFWEQISFTLLDAGLSVVLTVPMLLGVAALGSLPWGPARQIREDFERVVVLFKECSILDLFVISALAGLGEEALFRGVLQTIAGEFTGPVFGLILVSVIFGVCHAISGAYVFFATLIGCYLGALFIWFDNLLIPIAVHALYDFIALVYGVRMRPLEKDLPG